MSSRRRRARRPGPPWPWPRPAGAPSSPWRSPSRAGHLGERRVVLRPHRGRRHRRLEELVRRQGGAGPRGARARRPRPVRGRRLAARRPCRAARLGPSRARLAERADRPDRLRRRHRLLAGHRSRPEAGLRHRQRGRRRLGPSRSTGTPAAFAAFRPFSTVSTRARRGRTSLSAASMSLTASAPGDLSLAASSARPPSCRHCAAGRGRRARPAPDARDRGRPPPAVGEGVANVGPRGVGRIARAGHGLRVTEVACRAYCRHAPSRALNTARKYIRSSCTGSARRRRATS